MADTSNKCEPTGTFGILKRPSPRVQPYRTISPFVLRISFIFAADTSSPALRSLLLTLKDCENYSDT